jgi:glycosyltransferase involved in cell wall biosynthesis
LAGVWAKEQLKAKIVFDAHELMPESMGGVKEKIWACIEKRCITSCNHIIMPEKNRIAYFKKKYSNIPEPLLLENFPCKSEIPTKAFDLFRDTYPINKGQKIILYTGSMGPGRYIEELIDSMMICNAEFTLVILGRAFKGYEETIHAKIKKLSLADRVFLHAPVPHSEILRYMASCDIGTAFYCDTDLNNYYCASNKLYEYIALNKMLLTNNYPGLLETVESFGQGICLREVTPKTLAEAYVHVSNPGYITPGARKFFWEDNADTLVRLYNE